MGRAGSVSGRRQLRKNLLRIGSWSAAPRGVNALGSVLALLGLLAVSLGLVAGVVASVIYAHRAEVSQARAPVVAEAPAVYWMPVTSGVDERIVEVIALEPVVDDPPLPPGVERWPEPGEAVLSPAMHELLAERGVPDRYGRPVGQIGREGLASQTELLAYVRLPMPVDEEQAWPVAGFGVPSSGDSSPIGEVAYDRSVVEFWSMSVLLMVVPGVIALTAAARVADAETRRRHVLLVRLGAGRRARTLIALPRVLLPAGVSLLVSVALVVAASRFDLTVPFKGNIVDASVMTEVRPALLAIVVATHVVAAIALAFLSASRQGKSSASRLIAPSDRPAWVRTGVLMLVLAGQPWVIARVDDPTVIGLATWAAAVISVICLPAALATGLRAASAWRARRNLTSGAVGRFLGWRITGYRSRALARLTAAVAALVIVVAHAAAVLALFTGPALEARLVADRIGTSLMVASPRQGEAGDVVEFARDRDLATVAVTTTERVLVDEDRMTSRTVSEEVTLTGECPDLKALGVACSTGPLAQDGPSARARLDVLAAWHGRPVPGTMEVVVGPPDSGTEHDGREGYEDDGYEHLEWSSLMLLSRDGGDLDGVALARDAYREGLVIDIEQLGAGAIRGAVDLLHKSYWLFVFGVPGVLTLLLVGALTWAAVVIEESGALVRSPLLAERQDVFDAVAAVRIALPIAVGGVAGAAVTAWLLWPHVRTGAAQLPTGFLVAVVLATLVVAVLAWWAAQHLMATTSRHRWAD